MYQDAQKQILRNFQKNVGVSDLFEKSYLRNLTYEKIQKFEVL